MLTIPWLRPLSPMNNRIYPCNATPQRPHGFVFAHRWLLVLVTLFVLSVNELHVLAVSPRLLGAWSPATSMRTARVYHTAILLPTGRVLVMGGVAASGAILSGVEVYDPRTGRWATGAPMRSARAGVTAVLLPTGRVLVAGGASGTAGPGPVLRNAELYDLRTGRWTATGAMTTARYNYTATVLAGGRVLIVGGVNAAGTTLATAEVYDPTIGRWRTTGRMVMPRASQRP